MNKNIFLILMYFVLQTSISNMLAMEIDEQSANVKAATQQDNRLLKAIANGSLADVNQLIKEGVDIQANLDRISPEEYAKRTDIATYGTPLHFAVSKGNPEMVRVLIEAGADKYAPREFISKGKYKIEGEKIGETPIDRALRYVEFNVNADKEFLTLYNLDEAESIARERERIQRILLSGQLLTALLTTVSPKEIQHIVPGTIVLTKRQTQLGKNVGGLIAAQFIPELIQEKLDLAKQYPTFRSEDELRQEIINSINRVITKTPIKVHVVE